MTTCPSLLLSAVKGDFLLSLFWVDNSRLVLELILKYELQIRENKGHSGRGNITLLYTPSCYINHYCNKEIIIFYNSNKQL